MEKLYDTFTDISSKDLILRNASLIIGKARNYCITGEFEKASEITESDPKPTSSPEVTPDVEAGKICPTCGQLTSTDAKFCVHCGNEL